MSTFRAASSLARDLTRAACAVLAACRAGVDLPGAIRAQQTLWRALREYDDRGTWRRRG